MKTYKGLIRRLEPNQIFVFGSNTQGRHGAGAAWYAVNKFGAIYGQARGRQGQSYGIVTKDLTKEIHPSVSEMDIIGQIAILYEYAYRHPELEFLVAYSANSNNLSGYSSQDLADMFAVAAVQSYSIGDFSVFPPNIVFEESFYQLMGIVE